VKFYSGVWAYVADGQMCVPRALKIILMSKWSFSKYLCVSRQRLQ
jgi:hypothetical protein